MSRVALYMGLIEGVLAHNSDSVAVDKITLILEQLYDRYPILKKVEIFRDFTLHSGAVGYADIPDDNKSMAALRSVLELYFVVLANMTSSEEASKRMQKPVKEYLSARWNEVISTKIDWYLPNLALLKLRSSKKDIANISEGAQAKLFFETLFTAYITDLAQTISVSTYKKKLSILCKDSVVAKGVLLPDDGKVKIAVPVENKEVVRELCNVLNAFIGLSAFTLGEDGALEKAQHLVGPIIAFFAPLPEKIGAQMYLIYGRLSPTLPSNIKGLEDVMGGGFPKGNMVLFQVPSGIERNILWSNLLKDTLSLKSSAVAVVTTRFPKDVEAELTKIGIKTKGYQAKGKLVFLDWYSYKNEQIVGIDVSKAGVKSGKDLTNLEIGMEKSISLLSSTLSGRILLDSVSTMTTGFDSKSVYSFFQALKRKSSEKKMTTIVFVEKEMHDQKTLGSLHQVFDVVLDVKKTEKGYTIKTMSFRGRTLKSKKYPFTLSMDHVEAIIEDEGTFDEKKLLEQIKENKKAREAMPKKKKKITKEAVTREDYYKRGVEQASKRDYDGANKSFKKALEIDNEYAEAHQALGAMLLYGTSDIDAALVSLQKVVDIDPQNGDAWFDIGNAWYKKRMVFEAKTAFISALEVKPYYRWYNSKEFLCPSCKTLLNTGTRRCGNCGSELDFTGRLKVKEEPKVETPAVPEKEVIEIVPEKEVIEIVPEKEVIEIVPEKENAPVAIAEMACPKCRITISADSEMCYSCGYEIPIKSRRPKDIAPKIEETPIAESSTVSDIIDAISAEPSLDDGIISDEELEVVEEQIFMCPICGGTVAEDDPSCNSCGALFQEEEEIATDEFMNSINATTAEIEDIPTESAEIEDIPTESAEEIARAQRTAPIIAEMELGNTNTGEPVDMLEEDLPEHVSNEEWEETILLTDALIHSHGPRPDWILAKGIGLANIGKSRESLILYKDHLTKNAHDKRILVGIAYSLYSMERYADALKYVNSCLKHCPDSILAKDIKEKSEAMIK